MSDLDFKRLIEVNDSPESKRAIQYLQEVYNHEVPRLIATTRLTRPLELDEVFQCISLLPLDDTQIANFFRRWFDDSESKYSQVMKFLKDYPHINEICRTPIIAQLIAALHQNGYDLPGSRAEIYEKRFNLLLVRWDKARNVPKRTRVNLMDKMHFLSRLAFTLHKNHQRTFPISLAAKCWNTGFRKHYSGEKFEELFSEFRTSDNVIYAEGANRYSLGHLSYQEYLTARAVVHGNRTQILVENVLEPWWQNVLLFYSGISGDIGKLIKRIHEKHGLVHQDGLLQKMMDEARYTSEKVEYLVRELIDVDKNWYEESEYDA